jgi:hypothetical protein
LTVEVNDAGRTGIAGVVEIAVEDAARGVALVVDVGIEVVRVAMAIVSGRRRNVMMDKDTDLMSLASRRVSPTASVVMPSFLPQKAYFSRTSMVKGLSLTSRPVIKTVGMGEMSVKPGRVDLLSSQRWIQAKSFWMFRRARRWNRSAQVIYDSRIRPSLQGPQSNPERGGVFSSAREPR